MRIVLLHDRLEPTARADELDVLAQVKFLKPILEDLQHEVLVHSADLDLGALSSYLQQVKPELVLNLVESLNGQGSLIHLVPALLDSLQLPYTGNPTEAIFLSSNKVWAKAWLLAHGLPTALGFTVAELQNLGSGSAGSAKSFVAGDYIIKAIWEHASFNLDESALVYAADPASLSQSLHSRLPQFKTGAFAEAYIVGREFNVAMLNGKALPVAEIVFADYAANQLKIFDYAAKWEPDSFAYKHVRPSFSVTQQSEDAPLLASLQELALKCWKVFGLRGYARVDFLVKPTGEIFVLEINANPCLSEDAGFVEATRVAGLSDVELVQGLLTVA